MAKDNMAVFNVTRMGASHKKSGKPCQDASGSWQSDDGSVQIAVVSDGHGGDTYVRSDRGSKLAVDIAMKHLLRMSEDVATYVPLFLKKKGEVTARPSGPRNIVDPKSPSETELNFLRQDALFNRQVKQCANQDPVVIQFFKSIVDEWRSAIEEDAAKDPLTDSEKAMLGPNPLRKAYGATLLAFMRTPYYWFAFQIGDGKMLSCDRTMTWREPVPWDCNCFLNMTTSLCNSRPLYAFRYAFDGTGNFPMAVVLGSDGIDDSWAGMANLRNFYDKIIEIFAKQGMEQTMDEIGPYLTRLSETGSRDDMSMAGVLNLPQLGNAVTMQKLRQEGINLKNEFNKRKEEIEKEQKQLTEHREKLKDSANRLKVLEKEKEDILSMRKRLEEEISSFNKKIAEYEKIDSVARCRNELLMSQWGEMKKNIDKEDEEWRRRWSASLPPFRECPDDVDGEIENRVGKVAYSEEEIGLETVKEMNKDDGLVWETKDEQIADDMKSDFCTGCTEEEGLKG